MLKNKFKIIALLMVIILTLTVPIVRAEDNEAEGQATEEQVVQGAEEQANQNAINSDNYKQGDVYLTGDEVTIDYVIDGNLFVFANTVNINSQIGGDAFIVADNIFVNEGGYIFSNLFALAPHVNINGVVYDLYAYSNGLNINGYIYRDVRAITNTLNLSGAIGRNTYLNVNNMNISTASTDEEEHTLTSQGTIYGDLNYSSSQEISIPDGVVSGDINYTESSTSTASVQLYLLALGKFLVIVIIVWLLCLWLTPKFLDCTDLVLTKKVPSTIALGILSPIVLLIVSVILLLIKLTSSIALLSLATLFIAYAISTSIFVIAVNNIICKKLHIQKTIGKFGVLILTAAVLWLIALIPFIGGVISIIAAILGFGILINGMLPTNRNKDFSKTKNEKNETNTEKVKNHKTNKKENK